MRFMMFIKIQPDLYDAEQRPEDFERMGRYNDELEKAGALLALDGLQPESAGARIEFGSGGPTVVDGPYTEAKEIIGGYWIIQTKTREEAIEWASRVPVNAGEVAVELRQIFEMSDFPEEVQAMFEDQNPPEQPASTL
ncbi:YciI family protein [Conexibacter woesei]|uniref:YciI family protein n=1 Tax=Conexibacter woesei TaxID=191495 RepID=UPI000416647C|nr:YciI family protein [Conexibacter woesei]